MPDPLGEIVPRTKIWLERDGEYVFGLGICEILKAVERAGSIKGAAEIVGKSYRHIWSRIKEVEASLELPLVETRVGGSDDNRSELTDHARRLIDEFERLRADVFELVEKRFQRAGT